MSPSRYSLKFHTEVRGRKTVYVLDDRIQYYSKRFRKWITVPAGYVSDGASGPATDIVSLAWWVHDILCDQKRWDDWSVCGAYQSSCVLHDILTDEGRWIRAPIWGAFTFCWQVLRGSPLY